MRSARVSLSGLISDIDRVNFIILKCWKSLYYEVECVRGKKGR